MSHLSLFTVVTSIVVCTAPGALRVRSGLQLTFEDCNGMRCILIFVLCRTVADRNVGVHWQISASPNPFSFDSNRIMWTAHRFAINPEMQDVVRGLSKDTFMKMKFRLSAHFGTESWETDPACAPSGISHRLCEYFWRKSQEFNPTTINAFWPTHEHQFSKPHFVYFAWQAVKEFLFRTEGLQNKNRTEHKLTFTASIQQPDSSSITLVCKILTVASANEPNPTCSTTKSSIKGGIFCFNGGIPITNGTESSCLCHPPYHGSVCEFFCSHGTFNNDLQPVGKSMAPCCTCNENFTGFYCSYNKAQTGLKATVLSDNSGIELKMRLSPGFFAFPMEMDVLVNISESESVRTSHNKVLTTDNEDITVLVTHTCAGENSCSRVQLQRYQLYQIDLFHDTGAAFPQARWLRHIARATVWPHPEAALAPTGFGVAVNQSNGRSITASWHVEAQDCRGIIGAVQIACSSYGADSETTSITGEHDCSEEHEFATDIGDMKCAQQPGGHTFKVRAKTSVGAWSAWSNGATGTTIPVDSDSNAHIGTIPASLLFITASLLFSVFACLTAIVMGLFCFINWRRYQRTRDRMGSVLIESADAMHLMEMFRVACSRRRRPPPPQIPLPPTPQRSANSTEGRSSNSDHIYTTIHSSNVGQSENSQPISNVSSVKCPSPTEFGYSSFEIQEDMPSFSGGTICNFSAA